MRPLYLWIATALVFVVLAFFSTQPGSGGNLAWLFWALVALFTVSLVIAIVHTVRGRQRDRTHA